MIQIPVWVLVTIIWVGYGLFAAYQEEYERSNWYNDGIIFIIYAICSPLVFVCKALYGAFKRY